MSNDLDSELLEMLREASHKLTSEYAHWLMAEKRRCESEAERNAAETLRDSIRYRARAVVFHLNFLNATFEHALSAHQRSPDRRVSRGLLEDAALQLQFIFDDLVFNIISLFDYIGCYIGLIAEGIGNHKIDWRKAVGKAKGKPLNRTTVDTIVGIHSAFVSSLVRYRSEIVHFRRDEVDGHITTDLLGKGGDKLHVTVPRWFASVVAAKTGMSTASDRITDVAGAISREAITKTVTVLNSLRGHLETLGHSSPPTTANMAISRWSRAGLWEKIAEDPRLRSMGVDRVGGGSSGFQLWALPSFVDGQRAEARPIDVRPMLGKEIAVEVVVEMMVESILAELQ